MINVEKLQKEHFLHYDFVLPHFRGYPLRVISATSEWGQEHYSDHILNVAVSMPNEAGIEQVKQKLLSINVMPGE